MPIMATAGESKSFTPAPAGVHQGVCVDVIDKGILEVVYQGQTKRQHKVSIAWLIEELRDDGKPYVVFKRYTLSLNEKATLRKDLESWRSRPFTDEETKGFDLERLLGVNCLLNVQHKVSGDRTYANVVAIMPLAKGMAKFERNGYVREKDRTPDEVTAAAHFQQQEPVIEVEEDPIPF
jgi:hypothetical protein